MLFIRLMPLKIPARGIRTSRTPEPGQSSATLDVEYKGLDADGHALVPVIQFRADGTSKRIGIVKSIKWDPEGFVEVNGVLRFGGTCEDVIFDKTGIVIGMTIAEIGLGT